MKKLLQLSIVLITPMLMAQALQVNQKEAFTPKQKHFTAHSFQVEDKVHLLIENAKEHSKVQYYNAVDGGKYMGAGTSDEKGCLTKIFTSENLPAFVLNNGYTAHLDKKEFIAKNIKLSKTKQACQLNFEIITDPNERVNYQIVRIDQEGQAHIIEKGYPNDLWGYYSVNLQIHTKSDYELRFCNQNQLRYSQRLFIDDLNEYYQLYPTICNTQLNVDFLSEFQSGIYGVLNTNGQLVRKEALRAQFNNIDIANLPAGIYYMDVEYNGERLASKPFVKK